MVPSRDRAVGHHEAFVGPLEADAAARCVATSLTSYDAVEEFEGRIAAECRVDHAIATASGTVALHAALVAHGVGPGDAVLVPSLTFIGTAAAVCHAGATPVFLDCDHGFGIAPHKLGVFLVREVVQARDCHRLRLSGLRVAAIIPVHVFGLPCRITEIRSTVANLAIPVIEDAAQALGSRYAAQPCGSFGDAAILSFNNNKIVTTGGGGAILTNDAALAKRLRRLCTTSRISHPWEVTHDGVAWNYRMPSVCAAIGVAQMDNFARIVKAKRALAQAYETALRDVPGVEFVIDKPTFVSNRWLNVIMVDPRWRGGRDEIMAALWNAGLQARAAFTPMHKLSTFAHVMADNAVVAEDVHARAICLPSGAALGMRFL